MQHKKPSQLALGRRQLGLEQKQIANLLGQKTIHQYNRLENGQRPPSFKDAIKLSLILRLPMSILFDDYFQKCRIDLEKQLTKSLLSHRIKLENTKHCGYMEMMSSAFINNEDAESIRRHALVLMRGRKDKILKH